LGAPQTVNALFGGSIKNSTGDALAIRPGSLAADSPITFTSISEQAPRLLFPQGWSPLSVVDIVSPAAFQAPVGLSLVDRSGAAAGRTAVVARFDEPSTQWVAILAATIPPVGPIEVENVTSAGQYALLIADSGDGGPAAPSAGQPLESAAAVPVPLNATGAGTVTPEVGRADDTTPAGAVVTVTASTPLRSGSQLRGDFMELFVMRDGRPVAPLDTSQDFIGYRVPSDSSGTSLAAHFPITASRTFGATELSEGTITVSMFRSSLASQSLIGTNGGGVESSDGSRMIAPAGAFAANVPVQLRRVDTATFQLTTPPGTSLVGVLDLDLSGQTSATPLTLSLAGGASLAPTGSQVIVAELRDVRSRERLVFVTLANVDGSGLTTRTTIDALTVPGVRSGGRYVFLRFDGALALVTGTARDAGGRRDGHLTEIEQFPLVSVTGATGAFVLASPAGSFSLLATAAASLDQIRVQGTTGVALPEIVIGISPPRVESIVVRTPRIEGNFAGPVVLLGKPAPIVDDDGNGQSSGNGNGQVDAGERIELTLSVRNDGSVAVNSGAFALSVRGPAGPIAALPASIPVSSLAPDAATPIGPFVFEVPAGTNTALLQYTITFLTNAGVSNAIPFRLPLGVDHWNVSTGSEITIRFSEPVVVPDGAARLEKEDGGTFAPVETRLLTDEGGDVVVLRPLSPLAQESVYRITLTGAIVDADGRALQSAPVVERFRTEDRTPPPPIGAGKISASVPDAEGFVTITATLGSLNPDDVVILLNETTGFTVLVTIAADGSFSGRLRAELSDQLVILVRDRNGNETRADPGPLLRRDPVTGAILSAVLGPAGGTVVSGDGIRLIVPAGALPGATELSVSRVPGTSTLPSDLAGNASVAAAFQSRFTFADRFRIDGALHQFLTPVKVALSAPAGAPPGTLFLVVRRRMVTVDGPLADIDTMTGIPGSERPQRTVERLEIVESATVKEKAGQPIVSTDSPPFEGITESGEFELIRVTSGQVFFAGEVRRDSPTGPLVAGAVVSSLPEVLATSPFVDVTDSSGRFIVAGDATVEELLVAGTTVTSRLDATDPDFRRVIRRDVRGIVGPPAPANTTIAHLIEPFVLPAALPEALIEALGDIEPPRIDIQISSPSFQNGLSRAGDPLTVTVAATDNDAVEFVALELVDGTSSQAVALDADGTATLTPTTDSLLTFRAQARDRHDNSTFVDRLVRVVSAVIGQPLIPGTMTGAPVVIGSSETNVAFDGDIEIRFSEPLDPRTVTTAAVQLRREGPTIPVDFDIELLFGGTLLRIIPKRNLSFGVCYLVDLSSQIRDMSGEELQQQSFVITTQRPIQVATVSLPFTEDVALAGEVLVAINHPRNSGVGDFGAIHTFRVRDDAGELLPQPVPLAPADGVKTTGRPLSLAVDGNVAFVGNRFLGAIATQQPQLSTFIPGTTSVIPDTVLGCSVEPTMVTVCQGLSSQWANFPQPPSNLEAFSLADPTLPTRVAARVINFLGTSHDTEIWNPNTWPDRVEVTDQGIAVLNFGDNLEFFAHDARLSSKGVIGRVRRYGEVVSELEISDAAYLDGSAVIAHRGGVTLVATDIVDDPLVREEVVELDSVQSSDAFGARVGAVRRFQWTDPTGIRRAADLAFVAARGAGLSIYDVSALTLAPLGVLPGVFGNMSFDSCRGLAYVHGLNGAFHVIDFNDPTRPVDLNDGASPFTVQSLGSALNFNGNANAYGVVYLAGEGGIAMVRMPASGSFGRSCAAAPATTASSNTTSASFAPTALAMQTLTSASTGVSSPFSGPTSAKFRARVACRECQTPALKLPDDPVYSLPPGLGWTGEVEVTPNEGLVLRNVALHQLWSPPSDDVGRKMLTSLSVPFVQYKTNSDPEFESRLCPTNIPGCVSRLVSFQAPTVVVTRTNDEIVRKIVTEAEYLVGATDDATSCLRVIQRYEFTHELDPNVRGNPMCEPTESTWLAPLRTGLTCAKFIPTVSYEFVTSDPAITLQSVNVPQRAQFDVDGASANAVALFHDCEPFDDSSDCRFPIVGKFPLDTVGVQTGWLLDALSTIPTLLPVTAPLSVLVRFGVPGVGVFRDENPLRLETYNTVIDRGVAVRPLIDNFHQTSNTKIQLPLPPPGCEECVHLHWRWFRCALEIAGRGCVDPIDDDFMGGEPLIPDGSKQSLDVAVLNATVNDVDVIRGAIQRAAGSGSYRTTLNALSESPVLWRVARWARDSEPDSKGTFFSMQPIFFTSRP
jgi:hypothetical protein